MISQKRTKNEVHQLLTSYLAEHPLLTIIGKKNDDPAFGAVIRTKIEYINENDFNTQQQQILQAKKAILLSSKMLDNLDKAIIQGLPFKTIVLNANDSLLIRA
jgi:hypothetical protein